MVPARFFSFFSLLSFFFLAHLFLASDFHVSPDGKFIYIADTSIKGNRPALIVVDVENNSARRVLGNSSYVRADAFTPRVNGEIFFDDLATFLHVDSIGLDAKGEWLYFAAITKTNLFRIQTVHLRDKDLTPFNLESKIEVYSKKPMSDGIILDAAGNIYLTDIEHSAIAVINTNREIRTLVRDPALLRWPDGLSFDAAGNLYISCSDLHRVMEKKHTKDAPFHILKVNPALTQAQ